ncbi:MAG: hypothetical protein P1U42_10965 [Phycisphaerales bacterium]|nr:hypothetical protein [Phycisphaerales bacterium]
MNRRLLLQQSAAPLIAIAATTIGFNTNAHAIMDDFTWTLCTRDLEFIETQVVNVNQERVESIDPYGIRRQWRVDDLFFAIAPRRESVQVQTDGEIPVLEQVPADRLIWLTDGQVIRGRVKDSKVPDFLRCTVYTQGTIRSEALIPLEKILYISDHQSENLGINPIEFAAESDLIRTYSGDLLEGFIESIGVTTIIETSRGDISLDIDQVETIELANIYEQVQGMYVTTNDGLRIRSDEFDFDFEHPLSVSVDHSSFGITDNSQSIWMLNPDTPSGVDLVDLSSRVVSFAEITPELIEPTGDRNWTPDPSIMTGNTHPVFSTIDLHAPVRVMYPLPRGSEHFACKLIAPINLWTDCVVSVHSITYSGQRVELIRQRLNAEVPSIELNTELDRDTQHIEFRVDPGMNGPIQDRVLIEYPRLIVRD